MITSNNISVGGLCWLLQERETVRPPYPACTISTNDILSYDVADEVAWDKWGAYSLLVLLVFIGIWLSLLLMIIICLIVVINLLNRKIW